MATSDKDYINVYDYIRPGYPFQVFMGGRGAGKTYSALRGCINDFKDTDRKFIYTRRMQTQIDIALDSDTRGEGANPFKSLNKDFGWNYGIRRIVKNLCGIYNRKYIQDKLSIDGEKIGYATALSTIATLRGIDMSDADRWIYDEFCKERQEAVMSGEFDALLNAYETFNRNREFKGEPPITLIMLSNTNDIYNPIIKGLGIVSDLEKMSRSQKKDKLFPKRGLAVHLLDSPESFIRKKERTALYRLMEGDSKFKRMALYNEFAYNDFSLVKRMPLAEYRPVCQIDACGVFRHKHRDEWYVCYAPVKFNQKRSDHEHELISFRRKAGCMLYEAYVDGRVFFESYALKEDMLAMIS